MLAPVYIPPTRAGLTLAHLTREVYASREAELRAAAEQVTLLRFGVNDRSTSWVRSFLDTWDNRDGALKRAYHAYIREEVAPRLFPGESSFVIQATPNVRVHLRGDTGIGVRDSDPASDVVGLHSDSEFNHPASELNCILAVTDMHGTAATFYDPCDKKIGDDFGLWPSITQKSGGLFVHHLNTVRHFNRVNAERSARISLDFRIMKRADYDPGCGGVSAFGRKFQLGAYYDALELGRSRSGQSDRLRRKM